MSQTSDLISEEDCPESQATFSEKYTDDESACMSTHDHIHEHGPPTDEEIDWSGTSEIEGCATHGWVEVENPHACPHVSHWQGVAMSDDEIEIITDSNFSHYHHLNDVFYIDPVTARSLLSDILLREQHAANLHIHVDTRTKRQRSIARAVMIVSMTMFTISVLLVMISLIMSDHIDDLVRSANRLLTVKPTKTDVGMTTIAMIENTTGIEAG